MDKEMDYESSPDAQFMAAYQQTEHEMYLTQNAGYMDNSLEDGSAFSSLLDAVPIAGGLKMWWEYGFSGRDLITGQPMGQLGGS